MLMMRNRRHEVPPRIIAETNLKNYYSSSSFQAVFLRNLHGFQHILNMSPLAG